MLRLPCAPILSPSTVRRHNLIPGVRDPGEMAAYYSCYTRKVGTEEAWWALVEFEKSNMTERPQIQDNNAVYLWTFDERSASVGEWKAWRRRGK